MKKLAFLITVIILFTACGGGNSNGGGVTTVGNQSILGTWYKKDMNSITLKFNTGSTGMMYDSDNFNTEFKYNINSDILTLEYTDENGNQVKENENLEINGTKLYIGLAIYDKISNHNLDTNILGNWMKIYQVGYTLAGYTAYVFKADGTGLHTLYTEYSGFIFTNFTYETVNNEMVIIHTKPNGTEFEMKEYLSFIYEAEYDNISLKPYNYNNDDETIYKIVSSD